MDSFLRKINLHKEDEVLSENWTLIASNIQQQYYEKSRNTSWNFNGKREVLKMELQESLFESPYGNKFDNSPKSSQEEKVNMMIDVIYTQIYNFSDYKIKLIKPFNNYQNGNIKFPVFSVITEMHSFIIDQNGCFYYNKFQFMKVHKFRVFLHCYEAKTLKVHDFQALLDGVKCGLHYKSFEQKDTNASNTYGTENMATVEILCHKIYDKIGFTDDFTVKPLFILGKRNDNCIHYPVIRVAHRGNKNQVKQSLFYVDHIGRIYKNWEDLLEHNIYPRGVLCYPRSGTYQADLSGKVLVDISCSPAYGIGKRTMFTLDTTGTILALGSLGLGVGIFGSMVVGASALCGFMVGCNYLHDRRIHKQSLRSSDAMTGWLSVATSFVGFGSGALSLGKGLAAGRQLAKEAEITVKVFKVLAPKMKVIQNIVTFYDEIRTLKNSLKGVKITMNDVNQIFSHIKKSVIKLKNFVIKISDKVKLFLVEQWYTYFSNQEHSVIADSISSTISLSEELEYNMKGCETENEFFDLTEFVSMYKNKLLKNMEELYLQEKKSLQESLQDKFDESILEKKWGINGAVDRKIAFMKLIDENILESLKNVYDNYSKKVPILNELSSLKFPSNTYAINHCFYSCMYSNGMLTPEEYFLLIREVATDEKLIVETKENEHGKYVTYHDNRCPVTVRVLIIGEETFFVSTDFGDQLSSENMLLCENEMVEEIAE